MKVRIYQLKGMETEEAGTLELRNGQVVANPPESRLLTNMLREPIYTLIEGQERELTAQDDPKLFLDQLHRHYHGSRLWAGKAER